MVVIRFTPPVIHKELNHYFPAIKQYISSIAFSKDSLVELDGSSRMALLRFAFNNRTSAYQVFSYLNKSEDDFLVAYKEVKNKAYFLSYKNVRKKVQRLLSLKLIEIAKTESTKHGAVYFKLTSYGLFYLIWKHPALLVPRGEKIFENYKNNKLFQLFLYPYLGNSLNKIQSVLIFDEIFNYLSDTCSAISRLLDDLTSKEEILFSWQKLLASDSYDNILLDYLNLILNLQWLDSEVPMIEKRAKDNMIKLLGREHSVIIKTDPKNKRKLTVFADGKLIHELTLRKDGLIVDKRLSESACISEFHYQVVYIGIISRIHPLLTSILYNFKIEIEDKGITNDYLVLARSKNFLQTLGVMKDEIVKHHEKLSGLAKLEVPPSITKIKLPSIDSDRWNRSERERRLSDLELRLDALNSLKPPVFFCGFASPEKDLLVS